MEADKMLNPPTNARDAEMRFKAIMTERGIIFQGWGVKAIMAGSKTMTRRVVKNPEYHGCMTGDCPHEYQVQCDESLKEYALQECPYGVPGDRLWVRETWEQVHPLQVCNGRFSLPGQAGIPGPPKVDYRVIYRADGEYPRIHFQKHDSSYPFREVCLPGCQRSHDHPEENWHGWSPSIHMPRWASRLTLEMTDVRVERVQDISEEDASKEGLSDHDGKGPYISSWGGRRIINNFSRIWDSINLKSGNGWSANPWVWVLAFKVVKGRTA
jgi:hypothetical protein